MDAVSTSSGRRPAIRATDCSSAPPCRWLARTLRQPSSPWLGGHRHELDNGGQPAQTLARVLRMYPVTRSRGTEASYLPPHSLKLQRRGGRRLRALVAGVQHAPLVTRPGQIDGAAPVDSTHGRSRRRAGPVAHPLDLLVGVKGSGTIFAVRLQIAAACSSSLETVEPVHGGVGDGHERRRSRSRRGWLEELRRQVD